MRTTRRRFRQGFGGTVAVALTTGFVEQDGGGRGDVQRVGPAQHRQADALDLRRRANPALETSRLAADDDGDRAPQVRLAVVRGGLDPRRHEPDRVLAQPGQERAASGRSRSAG